MGFDTFKRVKNMVYTTSEDYGVKVSTRGSESYTDTERVTVATAEAFEKMGLTPEESTALVMHSAAHEGAHVKYSSIAPLRSFMKTAKSEGADLKKLHPLVQVTEDYRVDYNTSIERPGYWVSREEHAKAATKLFKDSPSGNPEADFGKAVSFFTNGIDLRKHGWAKAPIDWEDAERTARDLEDIAMRSKTSEEMLNNVYSYYKSKYMDEEPPEEEGGESDDNPEADDKSESTSDEEPEMSDEEREEFEKELKALEKELSGEDKSDLLGDKAKKKLEDKKSKSERDYKKLDSYTEESENAYENMTVKDKEFQPLWTEDERKRITDILCVGVHAGADILYGIRKKYTRETAMIYELKSLDNQARRMGNALLQALRADSNDRGYIANAGSKIIANKVWKPIHTGDANVFYHKDYTEVGGYVIDLVLDASGSQASRNNSIARQSYIMAQACSIAGIPCRVTQFRNNSSFTILERLVDFDDDEKKNVSCRFFRGSGDNRDGLAIRMANVELQKRKEPNKIMIVLSDGAPQDCSGYDKISAFGGLGMYESDYTHTDPATMDVYNAVREIRKSGTALMAIYVGHGGGTLECEKTMYGNDFAYIGENMNNFVDVVMKYLMKHIQGFDK